MTRIAIVGAGFAGLTLAGRLADQAEVAVFEKSRGFGGRLATRRAAPFAFDHGTQFFTARSPAFRQFLAPLIDAGAVDVWQARFAELGDTDPPLMRQWAREVPHYVGRPGMSAIGRHLAAGLDVRTETTVATLRHEGDGWRLYDDGGQDLGRYDWVLATAPAAQTAALMPPEFDGQARLARSRMRGCFALMLGFESSLELPFDAALLRDSKLSWISDDSSKPGRSHAPRLVALASNDWAEANMERDLDDVRQDLCDELATVLGRPLPTPALATVHRWRYANIPTQEGPRSLLDENRRLGAAGDWCVYGRVEGAFLSAADLADRLERLLDG